MCIRIIYIHIYDTMKSYISKNITFKTLKKLIVNNQYIKTRTKRQNLDSSSLAFIIKRKLEHGQYIQMGHCIENILRDLILQYSSVKDIKTKNQKGLKERDHLFIDEKTKTIFYAELKANPNLDTEKSKSTIEKCLHIEQELKKEYKDYNIKWCLLICRYIHSRHIPHHIMKKYETIQSNIFGINEYLNMLKISHSFTEKSWNIYVNEIANELCYSREKK